MSTPQVEVTPSLENIRGTGTASPQVPVSSPDVAAAGNNGYPLTNAERNLVEHLHEAIQSVESAIAPVWPLKDYVAVNPFLGLSDRPFLNARKLLRSVSDGETLMSLQYFQERFRKGEFEYNDVQSAVAEITESGTATRLTTADVLCALCSEDDEPVPALDRNPDRVLRTLAEIADRVSQSDWTELILEEIGQHLSAYYDDGQAVWQNPWQHLPLYQAWRSAAQHNRRPEASGLDSFCSLVKSLPHTPQAAIGFALNRLQVPEGMWESFLLCQAHSVAGWSAWTRYRTQQATGHDSEDFADLLAIRLAYDVAVADVTGIQFSWQSMMQSWKSPNRSTAVKADDEAQVRFALLRATEHAYERRLIESLDDSRKGGLESKEEQPLAQMVFCIDVRSERYRRNLESTCSDVQTFGFAGFFGVPIAYQALGEPTASPHVPALLTPQFTVNESIRGASDATAVAAGRRRYVHRALRRIWKQFQTSAVGCFGFVETTGLGFGWKLLSKSACRHKHSTEFDGIPASSQSKLGPDIQQSGLPIDQQIDMAESILRGIGIVDSFADLVVFCGHGSTVENNPLQAGLDCGACCGHSGEPNARFAAMLLNQPGVRAGLQARGINVPAETAFVAAVHDTTSDRVQFFDRDLLSANQLECLADLQEHTMAATNLTQLERMPDLDAQSPSDVLKRTMDWSEVRPEWGLAGNAAFIVAPRSVTEKADLDGRTFLHSYDYQSDLRFNVLEQIMTAPMVVAHWINMQYYASSVDNKHYGSGSKTIHNVVGRFGIFSGNGGDLTTGLPWQSVHNGKDLQHKPLRLLSVIAAPREAVADIIQRNKLLEDLLTNNWLNLVVLDSGEWYRFTAKRTWKQLHEECRSADEVVCQTT